MGQNSSRHRPYGQQQQQQQGGGQASTWSGNTNAAGVAGAGGGAYPAPVVYRPPVQPYYQPDPHQQQQGTIPFVPAWRPPYFPPGSQGPYGAPPPGPVPLAPRGSQTLPRAPYPGPAQQEMAQTSTIRNLVNVKKHTLRLEPVEGSSTRFALRFTMDASAPCVVTVFFQASEDPLNNNAITAPGGAVHPPMYFEKKLLQEYPQPGCQGAVLDLAQFSEEQLDGRLVGPANAGPYPLIIRVEAVLEKLAGEGHNLKEMDPGAPQKTWVQSQTTYAALMKREEEHKEHATASGVPAGDAAHASAGAHHERGPALRVLRQKIWVEGVSFELQEIYGMEHTHHSPAHTRTNSSVSNKADTKSSLEDAEERLCVICLVNERNTTVLPCRHMCMCNECAQELRKQTSKCPICRNNVDSLLHIRREPIKKGVPGGAPSGQVTSVPS